MYEFQNRDKKKAGQVERKREWEMGQRQACRLAAAGKLRDQKEQVSL